MPKSPKFVLKKKKKTSKAKNAFDVVLIITSKTPKPVEVKELSKWFDGDALDVETGEQELHFYSVPKTKEKIGQIARKYHLKVDSIYQSSDDEDEEYWVV